ncbi:MAG: AAA family ATPase [Chloroflexi bacterium]|nr:AAA family ATPase [Chloroflexota bacterium]
MNLGAGGDLVRAFPGSAGAEHPNWFETWFQARIEQHLSGTLSESDTVLPFDLPSDLGEAALPIPSVKLKSLQAHYFRGFRECVGPVNLGDDFIVIEGRNSSGKTSLAEALEWLFTGSLSRRESSDTGNARELEGCVANQFRPAGVDTWVSASFALSSGGEDDQEFVLRRELTEDYGTTSTAVCKSILFLDADKLTLDAERKVLDRFFAGVPPLLMQHTLRDFVQGAPRKRREYFERLLRLDGLTDLIRQAVVTDDRAADFPSPKGDTFLRAWRELRSMLGNGESIKAHGQAFSDGSGDAQQRISDALYSVAQNEFPALLNGLSEEEQIVSALKDEQVRVRQASFPILARLRPRRQLSEDAEGLVSLDNVDQLAQGIRDAWAEYGPVHLAARAIGEKNLAVSRAFKLLLDAGTIEHGKDSQPCPLCAYEHIETLSTCRVETIEGWNPIREAEQKASESLKKAMNSLLALIGEAIENYDALLPPPPSDQDWEEALEDVGNDLKGIATVLKDVIGTQTELHLNMSRAKTMVVTGISHPASSEQCESFITQCFDTINGFDSMLTSARSYRDAFVAVEQAVGKEASTDDSYRLREHLIACIDEAGSICEDLLWEHAKELAKKELGQIRTSLITYRQQFLESRRMAFNDGIEEVWSALRKDRYSSFSQLHIPAPRGRGFPIEIELKALLDDRSDQKEVDALRVFSESQVNALGVAAFVTRAQLLGHKILVLDDPVQSMDEEHFKTFARDLIPNVLNQGIQVILLTHNETFARDVSHFHYDRPDYVTMSIRHSRSEGSVVEEGNRRVAERLKLAEHKLEQGLFDESWKYIRFAIERLYIISYAKYGPSSFNPESWQHQTAESMWNSGAKEVILSRLTDSESRLKDILDMTVGGAHDIQSKGETDIRDSLIFLRQSLNDLQIGG